MKLPVVFTQLARREFDGAADWYEQERPGLGSRFVRAVNARLSQIRNDPLRYAKVYQDVRCADVHGFLYYAIFYRVESDRVEIISVFHSSRDPTIWQSRI